MLTRLEPVVARHGLVLAAALAVAAHLLTGAVLVRPEVVPDSDYPSFYRPVARALADGRGWQPPADRSPVAFPPGYPAILAAAFLVADHTGSSEEAAVAALNLLSAGLVAAGLFLIGLRLAGPLPALLGAVVWTCHPMPLWLGLRANSEVPFQVLLVAALAGMIALLTTRPARTAVAVATGVLTGLAMLVRPIAIAVPAVLAVLLLTLAPAVSRRRAMAAALLLAAALGTVAPWVWWSHRLTDQWSLLGSGGPRSICDGLTYAIRSKGYRERLEVPADVAALMLDLRSTCAHSSTEPLLPGLVRAFAARPLAATKLAVIKAARCTFATDNGRHEPVVGLVMALSLALVGTAVVAGVRRGGSRRRVAILVLVLLVYFWGMAWLVLSIARYLAPSLALAAGLAPSLLSRGGREGAPLEVAG
jgi:4-amino-4-deoxy-L-arabinose transferase-like glycosyltransferase